ncbi:hypothetical protein [Staphylococcus phage vB_SauM-V1SA15]|nr:hypothetical protein [Staphylococcus phage vB_SauM-V1SA15]
MIHLITGLIGKFLVRRAMLGYLVALYQNVTINIFLFIVYY